MEIFDAEVKLDHIETLKKQLDKAELKTFCRGIDGECLITLLKYQNIKIETKTRQKSNHMGIVSRVKSQKAKLKKETNYDYFRHLQNPGTPEGYRSMTSHFNVINKCGQKVPKKGAIVRNPYKKKQGNRNS